LALLLRSVVAGATVESSPWLRIQRTT